MVNKYISCDLCPNYCHVNRANGERGICSESDEVYISWSGLHKGEEPPISGENGSGMIFFRGCSLHCRYCQNIEISRKDNPIGFKVSTDELSLLMLDLESMGAKTLNLVTGTHFIPSIIESLEMARKRGLTLKTVWNSSGYESLEGLSLIDPYIDLYLMDFKSLDEGVSKEFSGRGEYSKCIIGVLDFIKERKPTTDLDNLSGVVLRHLIYPHSLFDTKNILRIFKERYYDSFVLSIMTQFVPPEGDSSNFKSLSDDEYDDLVDYVASLSIEDGFIQENGSDDALWLPHFSLDNPFPESFAKPSDYFLSLKRKANR